MASHVLYTRFAHSRPQNGNLDPLFRLVAPPQRWLIRIIFLCVLGLMASNAVSLADAEVVLATSDTRLPSRIINRWLKKSWEENEVIPSSTATEGEWCRRVFLDVLGRIPTTMN